jgi:mannose-6-phosphate isomerase-like protein (cupin superfamily)
MVIAPGDPEGGPDNTHRGDQWLYVVEGRGVAIINDKKNSISKGTLLLIEKGERHEIRAMGKAKLKTLNFYTPPQY